MMKLSETSLGLIHYTGQSLLTKKEDADKGEDWGVLTSAFVFISFFSIFIFFVTSKNT